MNRIRPYMNKFVKIKEQEIEDSYHSINLKEIKPMNSKLMEHAETIVINHGKREMIKQLREMEIERENKLLLQKIASVMGTKGAYSVAKTKNIRTKVNKSLNDIFRKRQMQSIELENKRFLQRLQNKRATLDVQKMNKQWMENKSNAKRIANADFNLTNLKTSRMRSITTERASRTKYENMRLMKTKVIDGQKMLIKIEFRGDQLKIIGDTQNSNDVKIIEIPKEEAILFIEKDCKGRLQLLLDKLRYNAQSQTLYLVSEYLQVEDIEFSELNPQTDRIMNKPQDSSQNDGRQRKNKPEQNVKPNQSLKQLNKQSHQSAAEKMRPLPQLQQKQVQKMKQAHTQVYNLTEKPTSIIKEMPTQQRESMSKQQKKTEHQQEKQYPIPTPNEHLQVKQSHIEGSKETKVDPHGQQKYEQQQFFEQSHQQQHSIVVKQDSVDNYAQQFEESLQQPQHAKD